MQVKLPHWETYIEKIRKTYFFSKNAVLNHRDSGAELTVEDHTYLLLRKVPFWIGAKIVCSNEPPRGGYYLTVQEVRFDDKNYLFAVSGKYNVKEHTIEALNPKEKKFISESKRYPILNNRGQICMFSHNWACGPNCAVIGLYEDDKIVPLTAKVVSQCIDQKLTVNLKMYPPPMMEVSYHYKGVIWEYSYGETYTKIENRRGVTTIIQTDDDQLMRKIAEHQIAFHIIHLWEFLELDIQRVSA
jgi:hypothetical protein